MKAVLKVFNLIFTAICGAVCAIILSKSTTFIRIEAGVKVTPEVVEGLDLNKMLGGGTSEETPKEGEGQAIYGLVTREGEGEQSNPVEQVDILSKLDFNAVLKDVIGDDGLDIKIPVQISQGSVFESAKYKDADAAVLGEWVEKNVYGDALKGIEEKMSELAVKLKKNIIDAVTNIVKEVAGDLVNDFITGLDLGDVDNEALAEQVNEIVDMLTSGEDVTVDEVVDKVGEAVTELYGDSLTPEQQEDIENQIEELLGDYVDEEGNIQNVDEILESLLDEMGGLDGLTGGGTTGGDTSGSDTSSQPSEMVHREGEKDDALANKVVSTLMAKISGVLQNPDYYPMIQQILSYCAIGSYVLAGIFAILGLFFFVKVFARKKCYVKAIWRVLFVLIMFVPFILGPVVSYGLKFGLPYILKFAGSYIPASFASVAGSLNIGIMTIFFYPGIAAAVMFVLFIIYAIIKGKYKRSLKKIR